MDLLQKVKESTERWPERNAFFIGNRFFTYRQFASITTGIRLRLREEIPDRTASTVVGVMAWDDIHTYASIFAVWLDGMIMLPLSPRNPASRNNDIVKQTRACHILSARKVPNDMLSSRSAGIIQTDGLCADQPDMQPCKRGKNDLLYILFTSGSTGAPKGVMITRGNFNSFVEAFLGLGYTLSEEDRFLQIYDLTFDASVHCYVIPLCVGGCIYTVPWNEVKYMYALRLLQNHELTFAKMPPSTIAFLRPYFRSIRLDKLRYCLFGGEALDLQLVSEWAASVPNAMIQDVYGPTEATVNCLQYRLKHTPGENKSFRGIVSIGNPFGDTLAVIAGKDGKVLRPGKIGELCLSGSQVSPGYWENPERNKESFIRIEEQGKKRIFYRTGDLAYIDEEGDFMYCGRVDNQVQIQGFRVELGEVECHARSFTHGQSVAMSKANYLGTQQIYLFVEKCEDRQALKDFLSNHLPDYMVPSEIISLDAFPLNISGKIDRKVLKEMI